MRVRRQRFVRFTGYGVASMLVVASIAVACSLNPQPIPPGDQPDASGGSANPTVGDTADGGTKLSEDAAAQAPDGATDSAPVTPPPDAGSDATDDASDAADGAD